MTSNQAQNNINKLFDEYLNNADGNESLEEMIEALDEVIYKALLEMLGYSTSCTAQKKLVRNKMNEFMTHMDFNNPSLVDSEKIIRAMGANNFNRAAEYLVKLYEFRTKQLNKAQSLRAKQPRKNDPFTKILNRMVEINPTISTEDAIIALESDLYSDVVTNFDDDYFYYAGLKGQEKSVARDNIPSRLARLRKNK
jgi:hypothetical protein